FLAGTCMQRQGQFQEAAGALVRALLIEQRPITLFRLGECFAAAGQVGEARHAFEECVEMCRGKFEHRELQNAATEALVKISAH
ncbi:MAG: tetratricopeptide repeat protein, partial [Ramlibacter sp.]